MRFYSVIFLIFCFFNSFSQNYTQSLSKKDSTSTYVEMYGNYFLGSNSISNSFVKEVFTGEGIISNDIKNDIFDKLRSENNTLGLENEIGILFKKRGEKYNWLVGLRHTDLLNLRFNESTIKLFFLGNASFKGEILQLNPFQFLNVTYQSLDLGIERENNSFKWFAFASLNKGSQYLQSEINNGTFYTNEDGTKINFSSDIFFTQNSASNRFTGTNGLGMSISGGVSKYFNESKTHAVHFMVRDLGWISYRDLNDYSTQSSYDFDGIEVNDILNIQDEFTDLQKEEGESDLENLLELTEGKKNVDYILPSLVKVSYEYPINKQLTLKASAQHYVGMYYIPRISFQGDFSITNTTKVSPFVMYGGWGKFNSGFTFQQQIKKHYFVNLQAYLFEYLFAPKVTTGNGMNIQIYNLF